MLVNNTHLEQLKSPYQNIKARVEVLKGSALEQICTCNDFLQSFTVEKTGEGKFFGFGICQKLIVSLLDVERELNITKENTLEPVFGIGSDYIYPFPRFYVQEANRDEATNVLNVVGYDILYQAEKYKVSDLGLPTSYSLKAFVAACAYVLGVPIRFINIDETTFETTYPEGGNFDGTESVRIALNAVAEATQTIYYINNQWELVFQRLDKNAEPAYTIERGEYIDFLSGEARTISNIAHITELGDNTSTVGTDEGITQFIRNNPFWELREDIATLLDKALTNIGGLTINQFDATWFGNYLLEIGDKIALTTRDDKTIASFILDDTITFDGSLTQHTRWQYDENEGETATNPITIGEAINQTYARVDKVNKRIELFTGELENNTQKIASLTLTTDAITAEVQRVEDETNQAISNLQLTAEDISASVSRVENYVDDAIDDIADDVSTLTKEVEMKMTPEAVEIAIKKEIANGTSKVETGTGFTFDEEGLTIQKTGKNLSTQITEDGMTVYRDDSAVLIANNQGVKAQDLNATTYLIVGGRSRFENYESNRTGCFWIGG